jgi:LAO/AO transport system kinase
MSNIDHKSSGISPQFTISKRKNKDIEYYLQGLREHNRFILSESITLLESNHLQKRTTAEHILDALPPTDDHTIRIGITGSPGVGKSTFIESFGLYLLSKNHRLAVLAIDPSSQKNKGSILGDKTRMQELAAQANAYVRPSPSGAVLGGTAAYTKEAIQLCQAAGFDIIIVETVGVGQSETEVDNITDINLLLLQPGAGDDIQGIKRGIVENADIFIINKADGAQLPLAQQTQMAYSNAIQLFHHDMEGWNCPVLLTSAFQKTGFDVVYQSIWKYIQLLKQKNIFLHRRKNQEIRWFEKQTLHKLYTIAFAHPKIKDNYLAIIDELSQGSISTSTAIHKMQNILTKYMLSE